MTLPVIHNSLYSQSGAASCQESFDDELKMILKRHGMVPLGRRFQPSLRDFVGSDCLPGIPLTLHAGLVLHGEGNSYTQAVAAILRDAAPLDF